jgi:hypothetical protein
VIVGRALFNRLAEKMTIFLRLPVVGVMAIELLGLIGRLLLSMLSLRRCSQNCATASNKVSIDCRPKMGIPAGQISCDRGLLGLHSIGITLNHVSGMSA